MRALWVFAAIAAAPPAGAAEWDRLPPLPDKEGFAGPLAGVSGGALLVAGGANFPGKKPWEGGTKVWTDAVFALDRPDGAWKVAGRLPRPLGYGVSVTHRGGVVCVGGSDAARHYADAFRLEWHGGRLATIALPPLPRPVANACGALAGDTLFVAGGQEAPDSTAALQSVYSIDLSAAAPAWRAEPPLPGAGRILAVAAACGDALYVAGGASLAPAGGTVKRTYLTDAYRYDRGAGWTRVADLPHPVAAAPSPAPADAAGFLVLGGDDGSQVGLPPDRHRGFRTAVVRYDTRTAKWVEAGELPAARVTVPCVRWGGRWVIPGGEARPGVRSPDVWGLTPVTKE